MLPRNLVIILVTGVIAFICYGEVPRNRYAVTIVEAMEIIDQQALEEVPKRVLFDAAMNGMMQRLDEHSAFITPEAYPEFKEDLDQEFGGVGIVVELNAETRRLTVMSPIVGTPGHKAGLRPGDTILSIDGHSTEGLGLEEAVKLMRGPKGDAVRLKIRHLGDDESKDFSIVRDTIRVESVMGDTRRKDGSWEFILEENPRIGYIRLTTFGEHSTEEMAAALQEIGDDVDGLILDLRNNAGGLLEAAVDISDMFIDSGLIVSTKGRGGELQGAPRVATRSLAFPKRLPMVVLTNRFSASASEIVSACLQDHDRAIVVGERSYGKGTVQNIIEMENGRSVLKLTTASYWRPSGKNIHRLRDATEDDEWGVVPNPGYVVEMTLDEMRNVMDARRDRDTDVSKIMSLPGPSTDESTDAEPDGETKTDPDSADEEEVSDEDTQLRKAIEYIDSRMGDSVAVVSWLF